jgi:hypothetical protein
MHGELTTLISPTRIDNFEHPPIMTAPRWKELYKYAACDVCRLNVYQGSG